MHTADHVILPYVVPLEDYFLTNSLRSTGRKYISLYSYIQAILPILLAHNNKINTIPQALGVAKSVGT